MSKELIEKLRAFAPYASPNAADLMYEAADALEAKAAPVGERDAFLDAAIDDNFGILRVMDAERAEHHNLEVGDYLDLAARTAWRYFQAGAAHQRRQAREVVMPERKDDQGAPTVNLHIFREGWNACLDEFARLNKGAGSHE